MIGAELRKQLIESGVNPDDVLSFNSRYDKVSDCVKTYLKMKDGTTNIVSAETAWYAARKNKRW